MNTTIKILVTLVALLLILVLFPYPHTTGPTEVGVVTVKWSPFVKRGVEDVVRDPGGTYFFSPSSTIGIRSIRACRTSK